MNLREVITDEVVRGSASGTEDDLESPLVEQGMILEVRHVAVENRTHGFDRLIFGVADGLSFFQKEEVDNPEANDINWTRSKFLIPAGKKLRARLTGCTAGDELHMTYEGFLYEENEKGTEETLDRAPSF
jgi:hypothetical protein